MNHRIAMIATMSAAILILSDAAIGQSSTTTPPQAAPRTAVPATPPALDLGDCPDIAGGFELGKSYVCSCPAGTADGSAAGTVYGSLLYTDDSNICSAAVHAGVLKAGSAGRVLVQMMPSPPVFKSTTQNGVKSAVWASATTAAFQFAPSGNL